MIDIRDCNEVHELYIIREEEAYAKRIGNERREFCIRYIDRKSDSYRRIQQGILTQIDPVGETIRCHKGCFVCCVLYVEANLQECESIAFYLYQHLDVMEFFLSQYEAWKGRMRSLGTPFSRCEEVLHEEREGKISQRDQAMLLDALSHYHEQDIPCPFLRDGECSIYDVRPFICVNHYVTTPQDWCRASNWCNPMFPHRPKIYMTEIDDLLYDRSFYHRELTRPVIGFMPTLVYRILTEGLSYVAARAGFDDLAPSSWTEVEPA